MNNAGLIVVAAIAILGCVALVVILSRQGHPEQTASHHDERPDTTSDRFYGGVDRPAGPDVEDSPTPPPDLPDQEPD